MCIKKTFSLSDNRKERNTDTDTRTHRHTHACTHTHTHTHTQSIYTTQVRYWRTLWEQRADFAGSCYF